MGLAEQRSLETAPGKDRQELDGVSGKGDEIVGRALGVNPEFVLWVVVLPMAAGTVLFELEATPRIELGMEVLQTSALPLGYVAPPLVTDSTFGAANPREAPLR